MKENVIHLVVSIATTTSAAFLFILATGSAAFGLLPFPGEYRVDGFTFTRWVFNDDNDRATFEPPPHGSYRGSLGRASPDATK